MTRLVLEMTSELPWAMRTSLEGYVASVAAAKNDIFADTQTEYNEDLYERFIFLIAVWRLWSVVDTQFWILSNSINLLKESGSDGLTVGATEFHSKSDFYKELSRLRNELNSLLSEMDVLNLTEISSPRQLLIALREA